MHITLQYHAYCSHMVHPISQTLGCNFPENRGAITAELPQLVKSKDFKLLTIRDQAPPGIGTQPLRATQQPHFIPGIL